MMTQRGQRHRSCPHMVSISSISGSPWRASPGQSWSRLRISPDHPAHPAGNGTPILFPFPNRIRDGTLHVSRAHLPVARHQRPKCNSRLRHDRGLGCDRTQGRSPTALLSSAVTRSRSTRPTRVRSGRPMPCSRSPTPCRPRLVDDRYCLQPGRRRIYRTVSASTPTSGSRFHQAAIRHKPR